MPQHTGVGGVERRVDVLPFIRLNEWMSLSICILFLRWTPMTLSTHDVYWANLYILPAISYWLVKLELVPFILQKLRI